MQEISGFHSQPNDVNRNSNLRQEFEEFKRMMEDRFKVLAEQTKDWKIRITIKEMRFLRKKTMIIKMHYVLFHADQKSHR